MEARVILCDPPCPFSFSFHFRTQEKAPRGHTRITFSDAPLSPSVFMLRLPRGYKGDPGPGPHWRTFLMIPHLSSIPTPRLPR